MKVDTNVHAPRGRYLPVASTKKSAWLRYCPMDPPREQVRTDVSLKPVAEKGP